jgi:hypothetical protein
MFTQPYDSVPILQENYDINPIKELNDEINRLLLAIPIERSLPHMSIHGHSIRFEGNLIKNCYRSLRNQNRRTDYCCSNL